VLADVSIKADIVDATSLVYLKGVAYICEYDVGIKVLSVSNNVGVVLSHPK
jgi:hypothetical protein